MPASDPPGYSALLVKVIKLECMIASETTEGRLGWMRSEFRGFK